MIKIGLTGGIGSGKSTVSNMLKNVGFKVIDADTIARDVLEKYPQILMTVKDEFGAGFFDWRGEFRRKEFGNHIFRFPKQRKKYEELIMPYILKEIEEELKHYKEVGEKLVVLDAPTLVEQNLYRDMDYVIVVWVDSATQIERVKVRDKLTRDEAISRINAQFSLERKKDLANIVIDNSKNIESTKIQVDGVIEFLREIN